MAAEDSYAVISSLTCRNLPGEIVLDILAQLPVKSLMRFRCVKKSWNSLIKNPIFIKIHTGHHSQCSKSDDNECFLLATRYQHCKDHYHMTTELSLVPFKSNEWKPMGIHEDDGYMLVESSKGLVCLTTYDPLLRNSFMILNPATRQAKFTNVKLDADLQRTLQKQIAMGFGFDEKHQDFKIVVIVEEVDHQTYMSSHNEAVIYSLNADSWKKVDKSPLLMTTDWNSKRYTNAKVDLHNHLHWPFFKADPVNSEMARFDLGNESFDTLALPTPYRIPDIHRWRQGEHLAVVYYDESHKNFEVWTMVRYGDAESWTKELTFRWPDGLDVAKVYCSQRNGDFIFTSSRNKERPLLYSASRGNHEVKELGIPVPEGTYRVSHEVVVYKASLATVNRDQILINGTASNTGMRKKMHQIMTKFDKLIHHGDWKIVLCCITLCLFPFGLLLSGTPPTLALTGFYAWAFAILVLTVIIIINSLYSDSFKYFFYNYC